MREYILHWNKSACYSILLNRVMQGVHNSRRGSLEEGIVGLKKKISHQIHTVIQRQNHSN